MASRLKFRWLVFCMSLICSVVIITWTQCGTQNLGHPRPVGNGIGEYAHTKRIECNINGEFNVDCRKDDDDNVFLPFTFINQYFEVYGKLVSEENFEWSHSYGNIYHPKRRYDTKGVFVSFENYNVESRDRVKCVSAMEGVPISTQWNPNGYFYPTQIAQFGLAHYSKNMSEVAPRRKIIDDGNGVRANWHITSSANLNTIYDEIAHSHVISFTSVDSKDNGLVWLQLNSSQDFILDFDLKLEKNSSLVVVLQDSKKTATYYIHYTNSDNHISIQDNRAYYGIGTEIIWKHLTRDLIIDIQKALTLNEKNKIKIPRNRFKVTSIILQGVGYLDNLTLSSSEHMRFVESASKWFLNNQDANGGWQIKAARKIANGFNKLQPGWYSAMSQGHAISLLCRWYEVTKDIKYLRAAQLALKMFTKASNKGGVVATFMNKYQWYEEYPTTPSSFVLNGFIYSLFGLYDLHTTLTRQGDADNKMDLQLTNKLLRKGFESLRVMLPFFDTGSGSFYDLRHFTIGVAPNIARWDYHATHVNQLNTLASLGQTLDKFTTNTHNGNSNISLYTLIDRTARRWESYMKGHRASHN